MQVQGGYSLANALGREGNATVWAIAGLATDSRHKATTGSAAAAQDGTVSFPR